jgi:hypothetical protein
VDWRRLRFYASERLLKRLRGQRSWLARFGMRGPQSLMHEFDVGEYSEKFLLRISVDVPKTGFYDLPAVKFQNPDIQA